MKWFLPLLLFVQLAAAQSPAVLFFRGSSGGLTPQNFPNLSMWFVAEDLISDGYVDGDLVTNWNSRVNNYKFTNMLVGTTVPVLKTTLLGGFPTVQFLLGGGSNQTLTLNGTNFLAGAGGEGTSFAVVARYTNGGILFWSGDTPVAGGSQWIFNQAGVNNNNTWIYRNGLFIEAGFGATFVDNNASRVDFLARTNSLVAFFQNYFNGTVSSGPWGGDMQINKMMPPYGADNDALITEFMVWTNYALLSAEYLNLYTNYFKSKYPGLLP
jgi:hypothetical protein